MSASLSPIPRDDQSTADRRQVEQWIRAARDGSTTALGRILELGQRYFLLVAKNGLDDRLKSKVGASDVVQETFVAAQRSFEQFRGETEQELRGWLLSILAHRLADYVRRYRLSQQRSVDRELGGAPAEWQLGDLCDSAPTPGAAAVGREEQRRVQAAIAQLREPLRSVLIARTWHGASFAEIGQQHGCSADAARKTWSRAVQTMQKLLAQIE